MTATTRPFIIQAKEYLELALGIENNIPIIQYLISLKCKMNPFKVILAAVKSKSLNHLQWLERNGFPLTESHRLIEMAARTENNIPMIEYLISQNCPISHYCTLQSAAAYGALNNLKWLLKNGISIDVPSVFKEAISRRAPLDMKKWLFENGYPIAVSHLVAKENDSIETLEWFKEQGVSFSEKVTNSQFNQFRIMEEAAAQGSLDNIKSLVENGCPINSPTILREAAAQGSLENIKWNPVLLAEAVRTGDLKVMKWLFANGCPIERSAIFREAAGFGWLCNMKWLLENGCPINDSSILIKAAKYGSLVNMKWLVENENGCPTNNPRPSLQHINTEILDQAAIYGSLPNMQWLLENGCSIDSVDIFRRALRCHGSLRNLKWLLENGCPAFILYAFRIYGSVENILPLLEIPPEHFQISVVPRSNSKRYDTVYRFVGPPAIIN